MSNGSEKPVIRPDDLGAPSDDLFTRVSAESPRPDTVIVVEEPFCAVAVRDGHPSDVLGAAALLYLVPFVLLFLGYAIGNALGWAEGGCVLIGFGFFALGVAFNVIYQRKKKASPITFEIIQIRES